MIKFLQTKILYFIQNKRAISLVMFAGFAMVGTTIALTTVNINDNNKIKAALQAMADQSVISAQTIPKFLASERITKCKKFFNDGVANHTALKGKVIINRSACSVSPPPNDITTLTATVTIPSTLGSTFGVGQQTININAKTSIESRKIEFIYALSTQGTMCATTVPDGVGGVTVNKDESCKKFQVIKSSVNASIGSLKVAFPSTQLKIGVVPYNYKVKFPDLTKIPPSLTALENEQNFFTQFSNEEPLAGIIPLTNNYADVITKINAMTLTYNSISWGRSDIGIHTAALMLEPSQKQFFSNHNVSNWAIEDDLTSISSTENQKYIVLMSDGFNFGCCFTNSPRDNYNNQYLYGYTPYNKHMLSVCDALKAKKVTIFTILLSTPNNNGVPTAANEMADNIMARCASGVYQNPVLEANPSNNLKCSLKTNCYNVSSDEETAAAFNNITQRILKPTIVE